MKLTNREIKQLILTGIVASVLLFLLGWAIVAFAASLLNGGFHISRQQIALNAHLSFNSAGFNFHHWEWWVVIIFALGLLFSWLKIMLAIYQHIQLKHVLNEINYIAEQNPEHEIEWQSSQSRFVQQYIDGVNHITQTTRSVLADEREVEKNQRELLTNVSHDLRTPLTSIIGYLGLIENNPAPLKETDVKRHVHTAYTKAIQLKTMVDDLFQSQTQDTPAVLNYQKMDLTQFFEQLISQYELESHEKGIEFSELTNPDHIELVGDPDKLARLFMNLIGNALKYGQGATFIRLTARQRKDRVEIRVSNNGEQIPKDYLRKMFNRFVRVDQSGNKNISGTGLGLAIAQEIVSQHKGEIRAESTAELTSFIVILPLNPEK